jgi:DNA-binding transcriptional LysR family regulator
VDLNLIRTFLAIYETGGITAAADRMFVTQSAASQSLGRLRLALDDPLFEREGRVMRPTELADSVYPRLREALRSIEGVVDDVHAFDARVTERTFRIALAELGEIGWFPAVAERVRHEAPRARLEVVPLETRLLEEQLTRGSVDLAISPADLPPRFERTPVKSQGYCVVMDADHPLARGPLDREAYAAAAHVFVTSDSGAALLEAARRRAGIVVTPVAEVQHFSTLPLVLGSASDCIATMPESIGRAWATTWPLAVHELPFEMEPVELSLYRRTTTQSTAALTWFHDTVAAAVVGTPGRFTAISG